MGRAIIAACGIVIARSSEIYSWSDQMGNLRKAVADALPYLSEW
jgi:hypothetical protein